MSYGYGGGRNPFDQRDDAPSGGYGAPPRAPPGGYRQGPSYVENQYSEDQYGRDQYSGNQPGGNQYSGNQYDDNTMEMSQRSDRGGRSRKNPVLDECTAIGIEMKTLDGKLTALKGLQDRLLGDASGNGTINRQLDSLSAETMDMYRSLAARVRNLKSRPDASASANRQQINLVDREVKKAIQSYQQIENEFRKRNQDQIARQIRIVRPDISEPELNQRIEDGSSGQLFTQTMMQGNRQGQAQSALNNVRDRDAQIQKIEQQMVELAQLFQDMNELVIQQEVAVAQIEQRGEEVVENLDKGNEEIQVAVNTARSTRKKKWWCLGITVLIIVIIVAGILIWMAVTGKFKGNDNNNNNGGNNGGNNNKRSLLDELNNLDIALARSVPSYGRSSRIMKRIAQPVPDHTIQDAVAARLDSGGNL